MTLCDQPFYSTTVWRALFTINKQDDGHLDKYPFSNQCSGHLILIATLIIVFIIFIIFICLIFLTLIFFAAFILLFTFILLFWIFLFTFFVFFCFIKFEEFVLFCCVLFFLKKISSILIHPQDDKDINNYGNLQVF